MILIVACTIVAFAPSSLSQVKRKIPFQPLEQVVYRLEPKLQKSYTYAAEFSVQQVINLMGMEQTIKSHVTMTRECTAIATTDSIVQLQLKERDFRVNVEGLNELSDMMGGNFAVRTYPQLEQYTIDIECTRNGKTLRQVINRTDASTAGVTLRQGMVERFTGGCIHMHWVMEFPSEPLVPGKQWTTSITDTAVLGLANQRVVTTVDMLHTYEGTVDTLGRRCAVVQVKSTKYQFNGSAEQMGAQMSMTGDGILTMRCLYELASGMPVLIETNAQLDQRMTTYFNDQVPIVIPVSIDFHGKMLRQF